VLAGFLVACSALARIDDDALGCGYARDIKYGAVASVVRFVVLARRSSLA
jgi:hypothetical protein